MTSLNIYDFVKSISENNSDKIIFCKQVCQNIILNSSIKDMSIFMDIKYPYIDVNICIHNKGHINMFSNVADNRFTIILNSLFVNPEYRQSNIGTILVNTSEKIAELIGFDVVTLEVKEASWMQQWYRKKGYREYGYSSKTKDSIWMLKQMK